MSQIRSGGIRRTDTVSNSAPAVSVLGAVHLVTTSRVRVTLLAGRGWLQTPSHGRRVLEQLAPDGTILSRQEHVYSGNYPTSGLALGIDMPVRLVRGLSVVPSIHTVWIPLADCGRSGVVRPSVGLRWTF